MEGKLKFKCIKCREKIKELEKMLHDFSGKIAVISGICEYAAAEPNISKRSQKLLNTAAKACLAFAEAKTEVEKRFTLILKRIDEIEKMGGVP